MQPDLYLICGGRAFKDRDLVYGVLDVLDPWGVVHGAYDGADTLAHEWAITRRKRVFAHRANWTRWGTAAGPIRNQEMLDIHGPSLKAVIAFPGGHGTADMVTRAQLARIPVICVGSIYAQEKSGA